jgi:hypothetical protein
MSDKRAAEERSSQDETANPRTGVKRPLVPVVLALMTGLAAAAWGVHLPRFWLLAGLIGLLGILLLLWIFPTGQK